MLILTNNRVMDAVAGQDQHFLKMSDGPFSHDAGHILVVDNILNLANKLPIYLFFVYTLLINTD